MDKIRVALFMTMNTVMTKYSGILNLLECMSRDERFEVAFMPTHNVPDCVKKWLSGTTYKVVDYKPYLVKDTTYFDYVITIDPYYGPHCKGLGYRNWGVPIIYKEYGVTGIDGSAALYDKDVYQRASIIITDTQEDCVKISQVPGVRNVIVGSPLFDYPYYVSSYAEDPYKSENQRPTVLWTPHCSICDDTENKVTGGRFSTFLTYKDDMLEIIGSFPQVDFVLKIHPYLRTRLDKAFKKGLIPEFDYDEWLNKVSSMDNVKIMSTEDLYYPTFLNSRAMINDSISFVAEYLPTIHPMLVLTDEGRSKYSDYAEELISECYYVAKNKYVIYDFIQKVVLDGQDDENRILSRRYYRRKYRPRRDRTNSESICDYILSDFRSKSTEE